MPRYLSLIAVSLLLTVYSCKTSTKDASDKPDALAVNLDTTANPAEDFFSTQTEVGSLKIRFRKSNPAGELETW